MDKIERVRATLAGKPADRPPFTVWYHFGTQHAPAERAAAAHLEFFEAYDLDLLKVMNDYDYPMPDGIDTIASAEGLELLRPFEPRDTPMGTQLQAIEIIADALRGKALFVDTVFNAWNTLKRNLVKGAITELMTTHPDGGRGGARRGQRQLDPLCAGEPRARGRGHLPLRAGERGVADPRAVRAVHAALRSAAPRGHPRPRRVPHPPRPRRAALLRSARRLPGPRAVVVGPERRPDHRGCGQAHAAHAHGRPRPRALRGDVRGAVRTQVRAARMQGGPTRFFLAPGCSVPTYAYPPLLRAARAAVAG